MKGRSSFDRRVKDRRDANRVGRRYERVASYQNSGGETVCAAGNNGKAKKTYVMRSVSRMASTPYISIDIYVYTCIGARLSTGSYFPVRQRVVVLVWSSRPVQLLMYSPTRITSSSLAHFSHFKCPLSFIFSLSFPLFSRSLTRDRARVRIIYVLPLL